MFTYSAPQVKPEGTTMGARNESRGAEPTPTRAKLVEGTALAASAHGLRAMTVEHILKEASLSRRTFYQHFKSKEEVTLALYEDVVNRLVRSIREAVEATDDPLRRLFAGIDAYLDFQEGGGDLVSMLQAEAANPASLLSGLRERTFDELTDLVDSEVRRELEEPPDPLLYRCLFFGLEGLVIHLRQGGSLSCEARTRASETIKQLFVQLLVGVAAG